MGKQGFFPQGHLHLRVHKTFIPRDAFLIVAFPGTVSQWGWYLCAYAVRLPIFV